jgi:hypothetical protein
VDKALDLEPWQATPLKVEYSADEVLWSLARQNDVAGPLMQAMATREQKERLIQSSLILQQKRGTPWSVEEVMRLLGWVDAKVLDRTNNLIYDGTANHDGAYVFNGGVENWDDYKIRLHIDEASRSLTEADRAEAAALALEWAPLRSTLIGWEARHLAYTYAPDPIFSASNVTRIVIMDAEFNPQFIDNLWVQYLEDGDCALRWRILAENITLSNVSAVALIGRYDNEVERRYLPVVEMAPDVLYEGVWTFIKTDAVEVFDEEALDG